MAKLFSYVGPEEIKKKIHPEFEGYSIRNKKDILDWIKLMRQTFQHHKLIVTYIIDKHRVLKISDRCSEHVVCAGGQKVLAAGELTFMQEKGNLWISGISNQSTGYCPIIESWETVNCTLARLGIAYPKSFTRAFEFRYCYACASINLIKDDVYECVICEEDLDVEWNFEKLEL